MKHIFTGFGILLSTVLFTACGNDSTSTSSPSYGEENIQIYTKQTLLDQSQKKFYLEFKIKNNYMDGIVAYLSNISIDLDACSVNRSSLNIVENSIEFSEPLESRFIQFTADFKNPCTPKGYTVNAYSHLTYDGTSKSGSYTSDYHPIAIDGNLSIDSNQSVFEYDIKLEPTDDETKIKLNTQKRYKLSLFNSISNKNVIANKIHTITIKSSNPSKIKFIDPKNEHGTPHSELTFNGRNEIDFEIQTYDLSGIADIDISVSYTKNSSEIHNINRKTSVVILSGEPASFSIISDKNVTYDFDTKWFEQKFFISALDKHNNIVNTHSKIYLSTIADFRDNDGKGNRILYGKFSSTNTNGKLIADKENHSASFKANREVFKNINPDRDFLLLFGDATTSETSGKWDIDPYTSLKEQLKLSNSYYGDSHANLGFAIGHNYINEICSSESKEWKLQIDSPDKTYRLDDEGKTSVIVKFPEYMIGKKIALSVDFSEKEMRAGEVHFQTLYDSIDVNLPEDIEIDKNTTAVTPFHIKHLFNMTDENIWVKNARVICNIKTENIKNYDSIDKLISNNHEITKSSQCKENGEKAFFDIDIRLKDEGKAGSISFEKCQIHSFIDKF